MDYGTSMTVDGDSSFASQQLQGYLNLWATKLLTHRKDYEAKNFNKPALPVDSSFPAYKSAHPAEQAEFWIFVEDSHQPATFSWVCALFGIDLNRVRTKIQPNWRVLYGNTKFVGTETESQAALQVVPNATPVVQKNRTASSFGQPHPAIKQPSTFTESHAYS